MAPGTIRIMDSPDVMAPFGRPNTFYRGRWKNVQITQVGPDEQTPIEVRKSLVGLVIPTIFTKESIEEQTGAQFPIPKGSRLAYASDVIKVLGDSGKTEDARKLSEIAPSTFDMYVLEDGIYAPVD